MLLKARLVGAAARVAAASSASSALTARLLAAVPAEVLLGSRAPAIADCGARRWLHASRPAYLDEADAEAQDEQGDGADMGPDGDDEKPPGARGGGGGERRRMGRPFLDPRAPRRQEYVRNDAKHKKWGASIDWIEHSIYCNAQREEDPDGFFFDKSIPEYDTDCDGDPFSNGYLTEDEIEFPDEYEPAPYIPDRIATQVYFLYSARGYTIRQLSVRYRLSSEKICAMIQVKHRRPEMVATNRIAPPALEIMLQRLHAPFMPPNRFAPAENGGPEGQDLDMGVRYTLLQDDQLPDDVTPRRRLTGGVFRTRHGLRKVTPPPKSARTLDSKFVFKNISGRVRDRVPHRGPMIISDFDGAVRPATNMEALYRSWEGRHWGLDVAKGKTGLPFKEEDAGKPADFNIVP